MVRLFRLLRAWKHLTLLVSLLALIFVQPVARSGAAGLIAFDLLLTIVTAVIFFVVFEHGWSRAVALLLAAAMIAVHWLQRAIGPHNAILFAADQTMATLFLGFAVTVVLRGIFQPKRFHTDDFLGVMCGYLLAGLAWGNVFTLVESVEPAAFRVQSDLAGDLNDPNSRRQLFDNFSFVTLTCIGSNRIIPESQTAMSLAWLESVFGQFYMAIVVSQLVGLKLNQQLGDRVEGLDERDEESGARI